MYQGCVVKLVYTNTKGNRPIYHQSGLYVVHSVKCTAVYKTKQKPNVILFYSVSPFMLSPLPQNAHYSQQSDPMGWILSAKANELKNKQTKQNKQACSWCVAFRFRQSGLWCLLFGLGVLARESALITVMIIDTEADVSSHWGPQQTECKQNLYNSNMRIMAAL